MATTTTIRVSTETRDLLNALSARSGGSAGEMVSELAHAADDDRLLADAAASFQKMASDPAKLAAYRSEAREIEGAFEASVPG